MRDEYAINYREYNDQILVNDYNRTACFSKIFNSGINKDTNNIILYIPFDDLNINIESFIKWVNAVNDAGFPAKYLGTSNSEGLEYLKLANEDMYIVQIPALEYKNVVHLSAGLTYIRYAYDYSGHCGANPHKICLNYFKIKEKYNVSNLHAIIGASILYGKGGHHLTHNNNDLKLYTIEEYIANCTEKSLYKGHNLGLWTTSNKFTGGVIYKSIDELKELYTVDKKEEKKLLRVYVVGGANYYANWLPDIEIVDTIKHCDLVLFTGGEDVSPTLYDEPAHTETCSNRKRDIYEKRMFTLAKNQNKKMLGICRGSQFLCVMNGGKLVQHQQNNRYVHDIFIGDNADIITVTSTHHQAQYPYNLKKWDYKILGWSKNQSKFHLDGNGVELNPEKECEIVYYPKTQCLGIQSHPEHEGYQNNYPASLVKLKELFTKFINNLL